MVLIRYPLHFEAKPEGSGELPRAAFIRRRSRFVSHCGESIEIPQCEFRQAGETVLFSYRHSNRACGILRAAAAIAALAWLPKFAAGQTGPPDITLTQSATIGGATWHTL